uniref:Lipase domain-containing protein n=2 Tax=Dendroctonus ponderosae TaxID=77166 RepID=A0AAR5Q9D1_DENPD
MHKLIILLVLILEFEIIAEPDEKEEEQQETAATTEPSMEAKETFTKCYNELGCVAANEGWFHDKFRPINLKPLDRQVIQTEFVLLRRNGTRQVNAIFGQVVTTNRESIESAGYVKGKFLFVLVHDFTSSGYSGWIKHISRVLKARTKGCNILSVDWHAGSGPPYDQAIANARVVALEIASMLNFLKANHELTFQQVHLIGHGVGAHIAGYVGKSLKPHKITGLDPSGRRFDGMPSPVRLDHTDAEYVEVLHTDAMDYTSQGAKDILGHTDFFINNAEAQPGCPVDQTSYDLLALTRAMLNQGEVMPGCSHKRAYKYYIESLEIEECTFLGIKCQSYADFRQGKCTTCGHNCRTFGLVSYSEPNNGSYFLQTDSTKPYCLFQYRVNVSIKGTKSTFFGSFEFFLIDKFHFITTSSMMEPREFLAGESNSFVFYSGVPEMARIINAKIGWKEKPNAFCFVHCKQAIDVERVTIQSINSNTKYSQQVSLCPKDGMTEIQNGDFQEFEVCKK